MTRREKANAVPVIAAQNPIQAARAKPGNAKTASARVWCRHDGMSGERGNGVKVSPGEGY